MSKKENTDNVDTKKFKTLKEADTLEIRPQVPVCSCGKTPLRCPHPNNCLMEDL